MPSRCTISWSDNGPLPSMILMMAVGQYLYLKREKPPPTPAVRWGAFSC
jgi:hypothetical protein